MQTRRRRAAPGDRLRHPAGRAVPAPHDRRQHRHRAAACSAGTRSGPATGRMELMETGRARPRDGRPLPGPALRRPAAARRRGPGAGRGPAGAADGRAVQRRRPGRPRRACRTSSSGCRPSWARPSCSSPTTSTRPSSSATGSRCFRVGRQARPVRRARRRCSPGPPTTSSREFLGRDRGIRRPVVPSRAERAAAHELRHRRGPGSATEPGWTLVLDADGRPLGWHQDRAGAARRRDARAGGTFVDTGRDSLRVALDAALLVAVRAGGRGGRRRRGWSARSPRRRRSTRRCAGRPARRGGLMPHGVDRCR